MAGDVQLNDKTVVEAKFVKEQGMDRQISDGIYHSMRESGNPLQLVTGEGTVIKPSLQREIDAGNVNLIRIADADVAQYV